jgi:hypothetical protein
MEAGEAFTTWREPSSLRINNRIENFQSIDAFVEMTEQVSTNILDGSGWVMPITESLRVSQIMDEIAGESPRRCHPTHDEHGQTHRKTQPMLLASTLLLHYLLQLELLDA